MGISPIGVGMGGINLTGSSTSGGKENVRKKLDELEKQKKDYEAEKTQTDLAGKKALDTKINSLDRRIENLQTRLDKVKEQEEKQNGECQTCKNRKYQDGSDDPGVSFKSATKVAPEAADAAVKGHEMEHVYRNQAKAAREGKKVVSQNVRIKRAICPECHKVYTSGGVTTTVTKDKQKMEDKFKVGSEDKQNGRLFDSVA